MKQLKSLLLVAVGGILISVAGCKKSFLDINDNPNAVTELNITPELIFPNAAAGVGNRVASGNFTFLENWMGYFSAAGDFAIQQDETSYNFDRTGYQAIWQLHYNVLFDLDVTKRKALEKGDSVLAGASMILSVKLWQELVDLYGNIPYSEAFKVEQTTKPKYDKAQDIYVSLHGTLDKAISYMHGTARATFQTVVGNIVKFGPTVSTSAPAQQALWIKFANTLKLRLLIRTSEVTVPGINTTTEIAKIVAEGGVLHAGQSVNVNPGYVNETGKQSPFYANYGFSVSGADANTSSRANAYQVALLSGDPRLSRFYRAPSAGGAITGTVYGQVFPANPDGKTSSKQGPGTVNTPTQDQWILTSVESLFLEAEAIARGWLPGTAATAYQAAITESFTWLGVTSPITAAATYVAAHPMTGISTGASSLIYQKYLALNSIDVIEAYSDLRRFNFTTLPAGYISANPAKLANKLPNRFLYPQEEYTLNFDNVNAQGTIDNTTIFTGAKIFWQP